jgi:acyl carrier protein
MPVLNSTDVLSRLQTIFRDELDIADLEISINTTPEQIDGWDSLATIRIVAAVEREFDCQFEAAQIEEIHSVADIVSVISPGA